MIGNRPVQLGPSACFVIEREPGKGYLITSAEGERSDELRARALTLLDTLGQPDPKGPEEYFRWVGPVTSAGEYVGVAVKLMPSGEARYYQSWFRPAKSVSRSSRTVRSIRWLLILGLVLLFGAGAVAGHFVSTLGEEKDRNSGIVGQQQGDNPLNLTQVNPPPDNRTMKLRSELSSSSDVRTKLKEYLSQEGFAADTSAAVNDEKRSVKLIADLDTTPPPRESIRLNNIEVAKLLELLRVLSEWSAATETSSTPTGQ